MRELVQLERRRSSNAARRLDLVRCCSALAVLVAATGAALALGAYPVFSPIREATDASQGHRVGGNCPENSFAARVGGDLYVVYKTGGPEVGNEGDAQTVFVRRFHLDTLAADPAVRAILKAEDGAGYDGKGYHDEPAMLRDGAGDILPLHTWSGQTGASRNTWTIPPRYRQIPELDDPGTWLPAAGETGLPSRVFNDQPHGAVFYDIMGAHDRPGGLTHAVGEGAFLQGLEFAGSCGLGRYYYRTTAANGIDGPYLLVRADCGQPAALPVPCYGGNIFTKGDVVLGREHAGPRSVHLVWNVRNTFMKKDPVCACGCAVPSYYQWNYNLYYARSTDGGVTWRSLDGSRVQRVADSAPGAVNHPLLWNDAGFLVYTGDVNQTSERSFDVDRNGNPVLVIKALDPRSGAYWPDRATGHVDNLDASRPPRYVLISRHWTGSSWIESVIDTAHDFFNDWTRVRVADDGAIWVFAGGWPWEPENNDVRPRYTVSRDGGATWAPWTPFLPEGTRLGWFYFHVDPLEPAYVYFGWVEASRIKFVRIQLSDTNPVPAEVAGLVHAKVDSDRQRLQWAPLAGDAVWYDVYRGDLTALAGGGYDHRPAPSGCAVPSPVLDVGDLRDGVSHYYLVAGTNLAQEGTLGSGSAGPRPPAVTPCR